MPGARIMTPLFLALVLVAPPASSETPIETGPLALKAEQVGAQAPLRGPVPVRLTISRVGDGTSVVRGWDPQLAHSWIEFDEPCGWKFWGPKGVRIISLDGAVPTANVLKQEFVVSPSAPLSGQFDLVWCFGTMLPGRTNLAVTVHVERADRASGAFKWTALRATFPIVLTDDRRKIGDKRPR